MSRELMRAAINALHEAFGTPVTRCEVLNRLLREYPDASADAIAFLLGVHDRGFDTCPKPLGLKGGE